MTHEERIRGLEDAVVNLSRIVELKVGRYALEKLKPEIAVKGEEIHAWARSVQEHRAGS